MAGTLQRGAGRAARRYRLRCAAHAMHGVHAVTCGTCRAAWPPPSSASSVETHARAALSRAAHAHACASPRAPI